MKKKEKKQEIKWNKNFSRTILLAFRDNPSLARAIAAFNRETRINAGYGIRAKPYDQITPFLRCSTRQNVATRATDRMCSELIYARDPFNRASPTVDVEMSARLPHFCPFRPIREYIFSRTCPDRYFSSYLDRSISRFEESVSFDSQSRRFFFIDERQVWEIRSFFLIWESIFNWIHQWTINVDHPILDARVKIILQSFILKLHRSSNDVPPPLGLFWKSPSGFSAIRFEINVVKIKRWRNKLDVDQSRKPIPIRDGGYFHQSAFCFLEMLLKRIVQILDHTMDRELVWEMYHPKEIVIERG